MGLVFDLESFSIFTLTALHHETLQTPISILLTLLVPNVYVTGIFNSSRQYDYRLNITCYAVTTAVKILTPSLTIQADNRIVISVSPTEPCLVYCVVDAFMIGLDGEETYLGAVTELARFVENQVNVQIMIDETPFIQIDPSFKKKMDSTKGGLIDRFITAHVYFDQVLKTCDEGLFLMMGLKIVRIVKNSGNRFSTECVLVLDADISGWKTIQISAFSVCSVAGARNTNEIRIDFGYERNRPSLVLWNLSRGGLYSHTHVIAGVFSRDMMDIHV